MTGWREAARAALAKGPAAMISILATEGSAPRGAGTRMIVTADSVHATIGGGRLEYQAVGQARAVLGLSSGTWRVQDWPLGPLLGQCCGGRVRLLIERLDPAHADWLGLPIDDAPFLVSHFHAGHIERRLERRASLSPLSARGERPGEGARIVELLGSGQRPLWLFGAGLVGQAIARRLPGLPLRLNWFDTRPETAGIDGVTVVDEDRVAHCLTDAPAGAAVLILTHDHALDYRLTAAALRHGGADFVGLIGSATKHARFLSRLRGEGIDPAGLTCPIGLPGIVGKEPDVIAMAVIAQLLTLPRAHLQEEVAA